LCWKHQMSAIIAETTEDCLAEKFAVDRGVVGVEGKSTKTSQCGCHLFEERCCEAVVGQSEAMQVRQSVQCCNQSTSCFKGLANLGVSFVEANKGERCQRGSMRFEYLGD